MKNKWLVIALLGAVSGVARSVTTGIQTLDGDIPHINLTTSMEAFRPGGATMEDAVRLLRRHAAFPICFEWIDHDRNTEGLTLGEVLEEFHATKGKRGLALADEANLKMYEQMAVTQSTTTVVGVKERTFSLVKDHMTARNLLNRVTQLNSTYEWKNYGTDKAPFVIVQPRMGSVLAWSIPRICGAPREISSRVLFGVGGKLTVLFAAHNITPVEMDMRPSAPGVAREPQLPDVQLDLCRDNLNAREVLNLTAKAAGPEMSWSVSGIKGLRILSFQKNAGEKTDFDK